MQYGSSHAHLLWWMGKISLRIISSNLALMHFWRACHRKAANTGTAGIFVDQHLEWWKDGWNGECWWKWWWWKYFCLVGGQELSLHTVGSLPCLKMSLTVIYDCLCVCLLWNLAFAEIYSTDPFSHFSSDPFERKVKIMKYDTCLLYVYSALNITPWLIGQKLMIRILLKRIQPASELSSLWLLHQIY